jgi:acyl carrier protein
VPGPGGLALELEYNTGLYRPETAGRMIGHLETLLTRIVKHPAVPIRELDVLGEAEKRQLLTWGASLKAAVACATRLPAWEVLMAASPAAHPFVGVLDEDGRPVPVGVKGEICLGGPGPGHGEGLPAGKWVENPFGDGWLCRTGELGKWRADGTLQCLGPADHRVHIRGFRVEPAGIESVLRSLPGVDAAVVVARTNPDAGKELVAYFTGPQPLDAVQLRSRLVQTLPAYLVPAYLVQLDALPLAPGGAVDTRRLPDPAGFGARSGTAYVAPRNALEEQLADIWAEVLDRQPVGVRDNFFDLGGHSLKATRVISKVHEALGIKIDLKDLFIDPTIEHLANYLDTLRWIDAEVEVAGDEGNEVIL